MRHHWVTWPQEPSRSAHRLLGTGVFVQLTNYPLSKTTAATTTTILFVKVQSRTRSSAVANRPRDASCLSLASLQYVDRKFCVRFNSFGAKFLPADARPLLQ